MYSIFIANKRNRSFGTHYLGRPNVLGNPFVLNRESERDKVITQYEEWFNQKLIEKDQAIQNELSYLMQELLKNYSLTLSCWCSPRACHAEIAAKYIQAQIHAMGDECTITYI